MGQGWEDSEGTLTHHPICVLGPGLEELKTRFCLIPTSQVREDKSEREIREFFAALPNHTVKIGTRVFLYIC